MMILLSMLLLDDGCWQLRLTWVYHFLAPITTRTRHLPKNPTSIICHKSLLLLLRPLLRPQLPFLFLKPIDVKILRYEMDVGNLSWGSMH